MKIILSFYLLFVYSVSFGQETSVRFGYTHSWISYSKQYYDIDGKPGLFISASHGFLIGNRLTIQPELSLVQRGFRGTYDTFNAKLTLYYLDLGIPVKYYVGENGRFYGMIGPYLGTGIYGRGYIDYSPLTNEIKNFQVEWHRFDNSDDGAKFMSYIGNRIELGLTGGLGARLFKGIYLDLRYNHGITNMYKPKSSADSNGDMDAVRKAKNRFLQISLAMRLNKKKKRDE
jgi:hypothetical protein